MRWASRVAAMVTVDRLDTLAAAFLDAMPVPAKDFACKHYTAAKRLTVGTMCSGTDVAVWALAAVLATLRSSAGVGGVGVQHLFRHAFVCEIDARKREFLWSCHNPGIVFTDMSDLGETGWGTDALSGRSDRLPAVDLLIVGFSCKDFSTLNSRPDKSHILRDSLGTSGSTFQSLVQVLQRQRVPVVITENVPALAHHASEPDSNMAVAMESLQKLGYENYTAFLDPVAFGFPQHRRRLYMVHVLKSAPGLVEGPDSCLAILQSLENAIAPPLLLQFLLPEDDPEVVAALVQREDIARRREGTARRWGHPRMGADLESDDTVSSSPPPPPESSSSDEAWLPDLAQCGVGKVKPFKSHARNSRSRSRTSAAGNQAAGATCAKAAGATCAKAARGGNRWQRTLTARERQVLRTKLREVNRKDMLQMQTDRVVDLSQTLTRARWSVAGTSSCVTPGAMFWSLSRSRLLVSSEKMALQGVCRTRYQREGSPFSQRLLADLAGNAFNGGCVLAVLMAVLGSVAFSCTQTAPVAQHTPAEDTDSDGGAEGGGGGGRATPQGHEWESDSWSCLESSFVE